jgi:hypothetical protein
MFSILTLLPHFYSLTNTNSPVKQVIKLHGVSYSVLKKDGVGTGDEFVFRVPGATRSIKEMV